MSAEAVRRSTYLTALEAELADEIARRNGTSFNFVLRIGLRSLAGLPVPPLSIPAALAAEIVGDEVSEGVSAA